MDEAVMVLDRAFIFDLFAWHRTDKARALQPRSWKEEEAGANTRRRVIRDCLGPMIVECRDVRVTPRDFRAAREE
jgi:hypothetical protein